jgi:CBS domain-containing protein
MAQVTNLMTGSPVTVEPSATLVEAARAMANEDIGPLPVVQGDRLVGMVTDRDLVVRGIAEERNATSTTVGDIASSDLVTVTPDTDLQDALELMARNQVRRLPVVENDRLVGIVAQADVARALDEERTGEVVQDISR